MNLIKEEVLEKLAKHKQTPPQTDGFIQRVADGGITYTREYIKNGVDRYTITQETSERKEYEYMTGSYEQGGEFTRRYQCVWQQEWFWDSQTGEWKKGPEQTKTTERGCRHDETDVPRIEATEGREPVEGKNGDWGFGILWNFCVCHGEQKFQELKMKGCTEEEFKKEYKLQNKIQKARREIQKRNWDSKWKALKNAVKVLSQTADGKQVARKLIQEYLDEEWRKTSTERLLRESKEKEEQRLYFPYDRATVEYRRKRERFGLR